MHNYTLCDCEYVDMATLEWIKGEIVGTWLATVDTTVVDIFESILTFDSQGHWHGWCTSESAEQIYECKTFYYNEYDESNGNTYDLASLSGDGEGTGSMALEPVEGSKPAVVAAMEQVKIDPMGQQLTFTLRFTYPGDVQLYTISVAAMRQ